LCGLGFGGDKRPKKRAEDMFREVKKEHEITVNLTDGKCPEDMLFADFT